VDAIEYENANGAQLIQAVVFISHAWGIPCWNQPGCAPNLCAAIDNSGILIVSVAGNEGIDIDSTFRYPPSCPSSNQVVVTASDMNDNRGRFRRLANRGYRGAGRRHLEYDASGGDPSGYMQVTGSSYAPPPR